MPPQPKHPQWITIRYSDGDAAQKPEGGEAGVRWQQNLPGSGPYTTYAVKCAQFLTAETDLGIPEDYQGKQHMCLLPGGFTLWTQHKRMSDGSERTDSYLYGLPHGKKFRSPNEFRDHLLHLASIAPDTDDDEDPWFYIPSSSTEPSKADNYDDYKPVPEDYTKKCPCRYCNQAVREPRAPGQKPGRKPTLDPKTKRELAMCMEMADQIREDNFWAISGLTAVEAQLTEHSTGIFRTGEICWYRGPINDFEPFLVVVCDIPNVDEVFEMKTTKELERDIWEKVDRNVAQKDLSSYLAQKLEEATKTLSLYTNPPTYRRLRTPPTYGIYICEYGARIPSADLTPSDVALSLRHSPGRYIPSIPASFLTPYLAHPIPANTPSSSLPATQFLGSLAASHITPFALLPWDHLTAPNPIRPRPNGKGSMAKYAAAFLGAEKINQYDLVRVTGPGIDKLDLPRIEAGYWKFLPLPLTEALMRVSCWIVYRDEEDTITHINVRGQLYSPFPLKAEYEVKEVTADEKVPVRHESVRKWPGIQNLETDAGWKATWFQYFPSIPGEVEIPVYADNQTPLRPRTDKENTSLELRESLSTPVMPLTPANIKDAHERFENMRVEGIEAMKTEISARWQEHWSFEPWEESLLRATDILGRFYSPNELYACAAMHEYPTPKPGLRVPIELGAAKVSKVAPQRAQAFGWSGFGTRDTKGEARDGELVHNLPASEKAELDQAVAEEPGLARSEMHWEEKEAVRPNRPKEGLVAMSEEEHRDCTKGAEDLIPRIDQRVVRRIGPVPGSWEDVQGSEAVWTPELVGAWEREDEKGNQVDRKKWVEYVERLKREEVGVISLDTSDEEEEESEGESDEEEEEDTITVKAAGNKEESKSTPNGEVRRREVVVTPRKEQRRPVDGRTILTGPAPPRPLLEDENRRHSLPSKGRTLTQAEREGRLETLKPIDGKKLLAAAGFGEKRKRHSIDNSAATKRAHVEKNGATPERIKVKRRERVEVSPDELSPVHPAGVTKERRLSWESPGKRQLMSTVAAGGRLAQASQGSGVLRQTTIGGGANEVRTPAPKISSFFPKVPKSTNGTQTTPSSSSSSSRPLDSTPGSAGGKSNGKHKSVGGSAPMWTGVKRHPNAFGGSGRRE